MPLNATSLGAFGVRLLNLVIPRGLPQGHFKLVVLGCGWERNKGSKLMCFNPEEARREEIKRQETLEVLSLKAKNAKALIGNRGYRRFIKPQGFEID